MDLKDSVHFKSIHFIHVRAPRAASLVCTNIVFSHTHIYIYMHIHIYIHIYACTLTRMYIYVHKHMCIHIAKAAALGIYALYIWGGCD